MQAVDDSKSLEEEYLVSDIDPESITFIESNDETNGSATGSFHASLNEDVEELSSSIVKAIERYSHPENHSPLSMEETGQIKMEIGEEDRKKMKEEYIKFGESIAVQLAEIPDSYSRSVAKLKINQILFEAEIGIYSQTRR